jgi:D-beta-D-heptose 7-phosphate kinase/D-beta-D-heptose 1-phosphate adenosyltransferase
MSLIFVNGTFDILHPGHIELLNYAKSLGSHLMIGIDSDRRVRELKGPARPIHSQQHRAFMLKNLKAVDEVVVFDSDIELINLVAACDIMVKGSDYMGKHIVGEAVCDELIFFDKLHDYSTTKIIQDIIIRG